MQIGAVSFRPYLYNTNALSASSLSRVSAIGDDLLASKTDFSELADEEQENLNPLKRGETRNFMDVLGQQMQMSRLNASRFVKPAESGEADSLFRERQTYEGTAFPKKVSGTEAESPAVETGRSLFMMQRAAEAYQMNGIA